jgi:hypothetical protein
MNTVFLDESGYTGTRLLDPEQPIFALASHNYSEEDSQEIKGLFFGAIKADELKAGQLMRRRGSQRMVLDFLRHMKRKPDRTRIAYVHKPFALLCKTVDWVVEPFLRRHGEDLYQHGENLALCNMMFVMLEDKPEDRDRLLQALYGVMSDPSSATATQALRVLAAQRGDVAEVLNPLFISLRHIHADDAGCLGKENLEVCLSLAKSMMASWGASAVNPITLYHDATTNMARQADQWEVFVSPDVEEKLVGYDRRTIQYPIAVSKTEFVRSEDWAGIQLADVLVGVVARCIKTKYGFAVSDEFTDALWEIFQGWPLCGFVGPEAKFSAEELGTTGPLHSDPMEFGMELFRKREQR